MQVKRTLISGGHVLTMDPDIGDFARADVLVQGDTIVDIAREIEIDDAGVDRIDATDCIVMPGFIDSHRHLWEGLLRNALPDADLDQYFAQVLGLFGPAYDPDDVYAGNMISALGAMNAGVTTVLDWSHIQNGPDHTDAAIQSLCDSGLRAVFAYGPPSRGSTAWYLDDAHAYPEDIHRLRKGPLSSDDARVTLALAALGPEFEAFEHAKREWEAADALGVRIAVHVGVRGGGKLGKIEEFGRRYPLNDRTTYIHCCTLSDADWAMIRDTGGSVSIAPQIDMQMGQGIPPVQTALRYGLQPSLSVDVETSAPSDMFSQMRCAFAVQRGMELQQAIDVEGYEPTLVTARDIVRFATIEGARANGLERKTGSLTPGKQADLQLLRTDAPNVLPLNDPYGAIVTAMDTANVDSVMVAGKFVKRKGIMVGIDLASIRRTVEAARDRVFVRAGVQNDLAGGQAGSHATSCGAHGH